MKIALVNGGESIVYYKLLFAPSKNHCSEIPQLCICQKNSCTTISAFRCVQPHKFYSLYNLKYVTGSPLTIPQCLVRNVVHISVYSNLKEMVVGRRRDCLDGGEAGNLCLSHCMHHLCRPTLQQKSSPTPHCLRQNLETH